MPRPTIITQHKLCYQPTDINNPLCLVLRLKNPKRIEVIVQRFEAYVGLPLEWSSISTYNLEIFKQCCYDDMATNSVATTCAWLASAIRSYCQDNAINPEPFCRVLRCKREMGTFVYVTEDEIDTLIRYYRLCHNNVNRSVAAAAILEFYTGARKSDVLEFTLQNIKSSTYIDKATGETRTADMLCYTSKKTKVKASIPVKPIVVEILSDTRVNLSMITTSVFDKRIKVIFSDSDLTREVTEHRRGKELKGQTIDKCVSSHTFRRSFATNLDRKGVNIEMTSRMMGHTNTQQTRRYVCNNELVLDEEAMDFFR